MENLMTKDEVCQLLRCAPRTFDRWRSIWKGRKVDVGEVKIGRRARFQRDKIEKVVNTPKLWMLTDGRHHCCPCLLDAL